MNLFLIASEAVEKAEAIGGAWQTVADYGIVGAMLVIILGAFLGMVWKSQKNQEKTTETAWARIVKSIDDQRKDAATKQKSINEIMKEKDDKILELAVMSATGLTTTSERINTLMDLLESAIKSPQVDAAAARAALEYIKSTLERIERVLEDFK